MCKKRDSKASPRLIAITGGLGSGKSTVLSILKHMGHLCIDVDQLAKEVLQQDEEAISQIKAHFGQRVIDSSGRVNRPLLREMIISDEKKRHDLENIVHPRVLERLHRVLNGLARQCETPFIFVEVPLLFEVGWEHLFDWVICVRADEERAIKRVSERHGVDVETAKKWLSLQMPLEEKAVRSHYVIENVGDKQQLYKATQDMVCWLTEKTSSCRRWW